MIGRLYQYAATTPTTWRKPRPAFLDTNKLSAVLGSHRVRSVTQCLRHDDQPFGRCKDVMWQAIANFHFADNFMDSVLRKKRACMPHETAGQGGVLQQKCPLQSLYNTNCHADKKVIL